MSLFTYDIAKIKTLSLLLINIIRLYLYINISKNKVTCTQIKNTLYVVLLSLTVNLNRRFYFKMIIINSILFRFFRFHFYTKVQLPKIKKIKKQSEE